MMMLTEVLYHFNGTIWLCIISRERNLHLLIFLSSFTVTNVGFRPLVFDNKPSEQYVVIFQIVVCNNAKMDTYIVLCF